VTFFTGGAEFERASCQDVAIGRWDSKEMNTFVFNTLAAPHPNGVSGIATQQAQHATKIELQVDLREGTRRFRRARVAGTFEDGRPLRLDGHERPATARLESNRN
jgi:hypothetical protein